QRAYVVHVGEELIRRTLRRTHENAIGEQKPLNKITMRLSYDGSNRLDSLGGVPLLEKLLQYMREGGDTGAAYATWKAQLVHSAGFEGGNVQVQVQIPRLANLPADPEVLFADLETGIIESVPVERADIYRTRFGITDPTPFLTKGKS